MSALIKTLAAAVAGGVLATNALAQGAMDQIEHHIANIDGTRFHYVTARTGDPVLLRGWPESWFAWRKVLPLLVSAGRSVVILDPRGFGESDKPAGGYDLDTAVRDPHRFLEVTNLTTAGGIDIIAGVARDVSPSVLRNPRRDIAKNRARRYAFAIGRGEPAIIQRC